MRWAKVLEQYVADEYRAWTHAFACITDGIVYERLAPGVLDELRRRNPILPSGCRAQRLHQRLTPDLGHPKLQQHLEAVMALMRASRDWA